jgi:hypothetical protein
MAFLDVMLYNVVGSCIWYVGTYLPNSTASHPRRHVIAAVTVLSLDCCFLGSAVMEAVHSSKTLEHLATKWWRNPKEAHHLIGNCCENLNP